MMENLWAIIGGVIATIVSGLSSWFFAKSKYKAEVEGAKIDNFDRAIDAYKKMYEDMIDDLKERNEELKAEVDGLKQELFENRKQIITLTNFVLANAIQKGETGNGFNDLKEILK